MGDMGFKLGGHTFLTPGQDAPLSRLKKKNRAPIAGATPPGWLAGCVAAAGVDEHGPAQGLVDGEFCGHGEPTFTVFDLEVDGSRELEVAVAAGAEGAADEDEGEDGGPPVEQVLVRRAGSRGNWVVVFDRAWTDWGREGGPAGCPAERVTVPASEVEESDGERYRLAVGFEYPCDAGSAEEVSWMTVLFTPAGEEGVFVVCDEEMA